MFYMLSKRSVNRKKPSKRLIVSTRLPDRKAVGKSGLGNVLNKLTRTEKEKLNKNKPSGILYYGDNLGIIRNIIKEESIDLIYLDPPFNSDANYNIIFETKNIESPTQIRAFKDTWRWNSETERAFDFVVKHGSKISGSNISRVMLGLREAIGTNDMMAYIAMMTIRLIFLHKVLKNTGSLYLHCDSTACHYLKIVLDSIFGPKNFRNEIIWKRSHSRSSISKNFRKAHDNILKYSKSEDYTFNMQYEELSEASKKLYRNQDKNGYYRLVPVLVSGTRNGETGKIWKGIDPNKLGQRGMHWVTTPSKLEKYEKKGLLVWPKKRGGSPTLKFYLHQSHGVPASDLWTGVGLIEAGSGESLGYPTQKPVSLLERIIETSSNEGDIVLDPFCGCGTAIHAAQNLNRNWIGIDITHIAIGIIEHRMGGVCTMEPLVKGVPTDMSAARNLAKRDKFQFEVWAVTRVEGTVPKAEPGGDGGIDGLALIPTGRNGKGELEYTKVIVSAKGGENLSPQMVRDLKGTVEREGAGIGILVCLEEPTQGMRKEAATGGFFESAIGTKHQKISIYTAKDYFDGKKPDIPPLGNMLQSYQYKQVKGKKTSS